ncbi:MAG: CPBP family intramembrane glutamic endopeptidase [Sterolibacterium sp.]|jgi:membrane protease YdiL (CAAX protease family)
MPGATLETLLTALAVFVGVVCAIYALGPVDEISLAWVAILVPAALLATWLSETTDRPWKSLVEQSAFVFASILLAIHILVVIGFSLADILNAPVAVGNDRLLSIATRALVVATAEEIFFRKYLLNFLTCHMAPRLAILVSALVFSGAHLSLSLQLLFLGVFLGVVTVHFRSVVAAIGFHAVHDFLALLTSTVNVPGVDLKNLSLIYKMAITYFGTLILLAIFLVLVRSIIRGRIKSKENSSLTSNGVVP